MVRPRMVSNSDTRDDDGEFERRALRIKLFEGEEVVFDVERRSGNHRIGSRCG